MSASAFFDPLTETGFSLAESKPVDLHIHECGYMRLDDGWSYQNVYSPFWRAYYNLDPGAAVRVDGRPLRLGRQRLVLLPENVHFDCIPGGRARHVWVHFSVLGLWSALPAPQTVRLKPTEQTLWTDLAKRTASAQGGDEHRLRHEFAGLLFLALARMEAREATAGGEKMRSLLVWMENSLHQPLDIPTMAQQAGMGARSFLNWFKAGTESTPMTYLKTRRIGEACRRLRFTRDSIEQIAETTGFADRYHFSRVFRQITGRTPADYRLRG